MARLTILSNDDINKLYKLPALDDKDRPFVFELDEEVVSQTLNNEKSRLSNKMYTLMDKLFRELLANFLEKDELFYQLTAVKKDQKDFTTTEINASIKNHQFLSSIYQKSIEIIKELDISEQNIKHYAELAVYHTVYGLRAMKQKNLSRLYLMCYANYRYLKISDHLVASFVHKMNYYMGEAEKYQAQAICDAKDDDKNQRYAAAAILSLVNNKKVADQEIREKSYRIIPQEKFQQFIQKIKKPNFTPEFYRWQYYSDTAPTIKLNMRAAFKALDFQSKNKTLQAAIVFLKGHYGSNKSFSTHQFKDIPVEFIPKALRRYVITKVRLGKNNKKVKIIDPDRYEVMLYLQIEKGLKTGSVTI